MNPTEIKTLVSAVNILQNIPDELRSPYYSEVLLTNKHALHHNCHHCLITDDIDVDVDKSVNIHYCETCELTFDIHFFYDYFMNTLKNVKQEYWSISIRSHVCPLRDFFIEKNKIVFNVLKKGNQSCLVSVYLKDLLRSRVERNIIFL
jgi:hypothetical protein